MKKKNIKTQETISKQRHSEKIKISLKVKTPNTKVSCFSKWYLVHKGKRDGKKNIPYLDGKGNWISPTIQEECNKVDILISNVYRYLCKNNLNSFIAFEYYVAEFEQRVLEVKRLHTFLEKRINRFDITTCTSTENNGLSQEEKNMLNAKRKSEEELEDIGIRIRRFNEYQQPLEPLRKRFILARHELERDFNLLIEYYKQIELINKQLQILYVEFCSAANTRIAWYWQGVLKKHPKNDKMFLAMPKADPAMFDALYGMNINSLNNQLAELRKKRDEALNLSIV